MAFEQEKATGTFETMLKRHLVRAHRTGLPCTDFDPELASAYLEGALGKRALEKYEAHLAACLDCTDAVVQLHALAPETVPQVLPAQPGWISAWWESLRDGLTFAPWKWGLAAVGGAAVLIAGFSLIQRNQLSPGSSTNLASSGSRSAQTAGSATIIRSPQDVAVARTESPASQPQLTARNETNAEQLQRRALGPRPEATPVPANAISGTVRSVGGLVVPQADVVLLDGQSQQARAATRTDSQGQFNFQGIPGGKYLLQVQAQGFAPQQVSDVRPATGPELEVKLDAVSASQTQIAAASPPAGAQLQSELSKLEKEELDRQRRLATAAPGAAPPQQPAPVVRTAATEADGAMRLTPGERAAKEKTQMKAPAAAKDDENFKPMRRKVRDKTFNFDRGIWIDADYRPQNRLPRTRLTRSSTDFERVQTEIPALTPFFDLGQVIVVWQGKVYEVRK